MTQCAQKWTDTFPNDIDLAFLRTEALATFVSAADPLREMQATWAFGLWGRTCLYDLLDAIEDPDVQIAIVEKLDTD